MKFKLVQVTNRHEFSNLVNSLLGGGWKLHGDMKIIPVGDITMEYVQALTYEEPSEKIPSLDVESLVDKVVEALKPRQRHFSIQ